MAAMKKYPTDNGELKGLKPAPKELKRAPQPKPNKVEKLIQDVTNRYRVTAREARDIVTSAATVADAYSTGKSGNIKKAAGDVVKQVKETGKAAVTGKSGTTAMKATFKDGTNAVKPGKQR
jgi:hypothetical protein